MTLFPFLYLNSFNFLQLSIYTNVSLLDKVMHQNNLLRDIPVAIVVTTKLILNVYIIVFP